MNDRRLEKWWWNFHEYYFSIGPICNYLTAVVPATILVNACYSCAVQVQHFQLFFFNHHFLFRFTCFFYLENRFHKEYWETNILGRWKPEASICETRTVVADKKFGDINQRQGILHHQSTVHGWSEICFFILMIARVNCSLYIYRLRPAVALTSSYSFNFICPENKNCIQIRVWYSIDDFGNMQIGAIHSNLPKYLNSFINIICVSWCVL